MKKLFTSLLFAFVLGCTTLLPGTAVFKELETSNTATLNLYKACSDTNGNFRPTQTGCDLTRLKTSVQDTLSLAETTISKDVTQTPPYIIYLETAIIYERVSMGSDGDFYTRAEQISRQFFEIQKASSELSLTQAEFYLAYLTTGHAAYQLLHSPQELTAGRKTELVFALQQGVAALPVMADPVRKARLQSALNVLQVIIGRIQ